MPIDVDVLEDNAETVDVFLSCQLSFVGMAGVCLGLSATEADAAMRLHRIPGSRRRDVWAGLQLMGRTQAAEYQKKAPEPKPK